MGHDREQAHQPAPEIGRDGDTDDGRMTKSEGHFSPGAVLIAGPTASGKSALALDLAERLGGEVVNADSMQIYDGLRILTARPSPAEEARVPHRLYGHVDPGRPFSVADWLADAEAVLAEIRAAGRMPIFVGGTGLYFEALVKGLAPVPEIPEAVRADWRATAERIGAAGLHGELMRRDPVMAERLRPTDTQRLTRALEVIEATGRSLADWQAAPHSTPLVAPETALRIVLEPARAELHRRIAARFAAMVEEGAVEEAADFVARGLPPEMPAMRAIGVAALAEVAAGRTSLAAGIERGIVETRQYAKRQSTWFRGRMADWRRVETVDEARAMVAAGTGRNR
jgi:tRNA dimethylallyltransferase